MKRYLNLGTPLSMKQLKGVNGGRIEDQYSTCSTTCPNGGSVTSYCIADCKSEDGIRTYCPGSDGSVYGEKKC